MLSLQLKKTSSLNNCSITAMECNCTKNTLFCSSTIGLSKCADKGHGALLLQKFSPLPPDSRNSTVALKNKTYLLNWAQAEKKKNITCSNMLQKQNKT